MPDWTHAAPSMLAAFLASLVEFVEAMTIVLAVGAVRGWRGALGGTGLALAVLLAIVLAFGPALADIPRNLVQFGVGLLLVLFGMRWLRKAVLRSAGILPLHDEAAAYETEIETLRGIGGIATGWDSVAVATSFKITMLEGIEVVFIVIAVGAAGPGLLAPAAIGALAALVLVVALGLALHRPVAKIPENTLKFVVGVLLSAFGTFWVGEGMAAMARSGLVAACLECRVPGRRPARRPTRPEGLNARVDNDRPRGRRHVRRRRARCRDNSFVGGGDGAAVAPKPTAGGGARASVRGARGDSGRKCHPPSAPRPRAVMLWLAVALGSALGGTARFAVGLLMQRVLGDGFPWGTLLINVLGSFAIGLFGALTQPHGAMPASTIVRVFAMVGICGGFTTFSAFSLQTMELLQAGEILPAALYAAGCVALCVGGTFLGYFVATRLGMPLRT